ncbi:hypothetical protein [Saccharothrix variisporea]|uniref:Uncharacterized protein n=1 Tax=Saccharothrix variisporea TaxID=543527 RepID=A0A495XH25_9PSEU|nr:hypothetical protein [Saccharothrix variisporea]RKT72044.1 hypothetical protein DFJ66_5347 [Saccharothrix variisporea]
MEFVFGDKVGRDVYRQSGQNNSITVDNARSASPEKLEEAVTELRAFIAQLTRDGVVGEDGTVADPAELAAAVEAEPSRLPALRNAIAGGARDGVLSVVKDGVAALIVALTERML